MKQNAAQKNPQTLMVQGTTSDAGKSVLVAAICRILARHGNSVAPFKPQNMALNSAVTADGGEIGRAQAVQAEACYLEPSVTMNPVLLKPNTDIGAQVIVNGRAVGNMDSRQYHAYKPQLLEQVMAAHDGLKAQYGIVVVEGAGSPAEINLRDRDIANMGFAEVADCPVILVADIDRGGVFAHLVGTLELLSESERDRVKGFVINRFRGDIALLEPGLRWLEARTGKPVLGVIPYIRDLHIEAEDAFAMQQLEAAEQQLRAAVISYPRTSNHTDFDVLRMHPQVDCQFVRDVRRFSGADLLLLPGSKSVRNDLQWLADMGWREIIYRHLRLGGKLIGICGGYQMLGQRVHDPQGVESTAGSSDGLGLLAMETTLTGDKTLRNVTGYKRDTGSPLAGYEIHAGISRGLALNNPVFNVLDGDGGEVGEGAVNDENTVMGSYLHGLFDQPALLTEILDWAGLRHAEPFDYPAYRAAQIDRLAGVVEAAIPIATLYNLLSMEP